MSSSTSRSLPALVAEASAAFLDYLPPLDLLSLSGVCRELREILGHENPYWEYRLGGEGLGGACARHDDHRSPELHFVNELDPLARALLLHPERIEENDSGQQSSLLEDVLMGGKMTAKEALLSLALTAKNWERGAFKESVVSLPKLSTLPEKLTQADLNAVKDRKKREAHSEWEVACDAAGCASPFSRAFRIIVSEPPFGAHAYIFHTAGPNAEDLHEIVSPASSESSRAAALQALAEAPKDTFRAASRGQPPPVCRSRMCKNPGAYTKACSRCKKVRYCSTTCQRADFPFHKMECSSSQLPGFRPSRAETGGRGPCRVGTPFVTRIAPLYRLTDGAWADQSVLVGEDLFFSRGFVDDDLEPLTMLGRNTWPRLVEASFAAHVGGGKFTGPSDSSTVLEIADLDSKIVKTPLAVPTSCGVFDVNTGFVLRQTDNSQLAQFLDLQVAGKVPPPDDSTSLAMKKYYANVSNAQYELAQSSQLTECIVFFCGQDAVFCDEVHTRGSTEPELCGEVLHGDPDELAIHWHSNITPSAPEEPGAGNSRIHYLSYNPDVQIPREYWVHASRGGRQADAAVLSADLCVMASLAAQDKYWARHLGCTDFDVATTSNGGFGSTGRIGVSYSTQLGGTNRAGFLMFERNKKPTKLLDASWTVTGLPCTQDIGRGVKSFCFVGSRGIMLLCVDGDRRSLRFWDFAVRWVPNLGCVRVS